jgi:antitoxin component YwqK of YwqJK toxin-antitoxin module
MNPTKFKIIILVLFIIPTLILSYDTEVIKVNTKEYLIISEVTYLTKSRKLEKIKEKFDSEKQLASIVFNSKGSASIKSKKNKDINGKSMVLHGSTKYFKRRDYKNLLVKEMTYNYGSLNGEVRYYNLDGSLSKIECYLDGIKEGFQIEYDSNGEISSKEYILKGQKIKIKI